MILYSMLIVSYLVGSLSFAIIISKMMKMDDPRSYGSHNAGATNVMRSGNKKAAILTLVGDLLKGLIVVLIARFITRGIDGGDAIVGICGVVAVIGHIYPIFFRFKGGKGVATAIGVILGFSPLLALLLIITWIIVFKVSKVSSLSAILATLFSPLYAYILMGNSSYFGATTVIAFFVIYKHKDNIIRLIRGTESSFKQNNQVEKSFNDQEDKPEPVVHSTRTVPAFYDILGVTPNASHEEIIEAYKDITQKVEISEIEPGDDHVINKRRYSLELINEAFRTLSDEDKRKAYDISLKTVPTSVEQND